MSRRPVDHRVDLAGRLGAVPATDVGVAADDVAAAGRGREAVALRAAEAAQVDRQLRRPSANLDHAAHRNPAQGALDQEVAAAVEAEVAQIDDRVAHANRFARVATNASMVPNRSMARASSAYFSVRPGFHTLSPSRSRSGRTSGSS